MDKVIIKGEFFAEVLLEHLEFEGITELCGMTNVEIEQAYLNYFFASFQDLPFYIETSNETIEQEEVE